LPVGTEENHEYCCDNLSPGWILCRTSS